MKKALLHSLLVAITVYIGTNFTYSQCSPPASPTSNNITVDCGDPATLTASGSTGNYVWFGDSNGTNILGSGNSLSLGNIFANTTVYVGANSGGGVITDSLVFTNSGATGANGPSQTQVNNSYAGTSLDGLVTVAGGIQQWTVPATGTYIIDVYGAEGGTSNGGLGAYQSGEFTLNAGDVLNILVGQVGTTTGGGGGTFVVDQTNTPLIIAGGGGAGVTGAWSQSGGTTTNDGNSGCLNSAPINNGGTGGGAGGPDNCSNSGGGGGFSGSATGGDGGQSFLAGGAGGSNGGFGGGGGNRGGGGGFSGGGSGGCGGGARVGGGGGSFNNGTNIVSIGSINSGNGLVVIKSTACLSNLVAVTAFINGPQDPTTNNITIDCGDPATLTASGSTGNYEWFSDANGNNSIGTGNSISLGNLLADSTVYVAATDGSSITTSTDVYNIALGNLLGMTSGPSNTRYACSDNNQGFQWTDATPTGATITSVTIEFKIGVECAPNNKTSALNGAGQPNFNSAVSHCSTTSPGPGSFITLTINPADYIIGANNIFSTAGHTSCFGFELAAALGNNFARVTVEYELGTQGCLSNLIPVTADVNGPQDPTANNVTVNCGDPATLTVTGSTGNYEWFSDANGNNAIGSGNSISLGNLFADSTVYVAATSGSFTSSTDVYNIVLGDLLNVASGNTNSRYSCGNNQQGFQWTDATPTGATITSVTIEFKIGVECAPNNKTSTLNGAAQPGFNSAVNHCSLASPGPGSFITLTINPADYIIGANNIFSTAGHTSCFGFELDAALANNFARVTVEYEQGTPGCLSNLIPVTADVNGPQDPTANNVTVDCGDPATLTASGSTGNYEWFSDVNGNNSIGTGNSLSLGNIFVDSTVYVAATSSSSSVQTFSFTTPPQICNTGGCNLNFTVNSAPTNPISAATIEVFYRGDFGAASENFAVIGEGNNIGTSTGNFECATNYNSQTFNASQAQITNWSSDGTINVVLDASTAVNFCTNYFDAYIVITYDYNQGSQGCLSNLVAVTANVNGPPEPTPNGPFEICEGQTTVVDVNSTNSVIWYSDVNGTNQIGTGNTYTTPVLNTTTTYYVEANSGSSGPAGTYDQTILDNTPTDPTTFTFAGTPTGCTGGAVLTVTARGDLDGTGGNLEEWSIDDENNANIGSIGASGAQCSAILTVTIPLTPTQIDAWAANGNIVFTAEDIPGNINTTLCGDEFIEMQLTYNYGTVSSSCSSNLEPVTVTVNPAPTPPTISGGGTFCFGEQVTLTATGASVPAGQLSWFENTVANPSIGTGSSVTLSPNGTTDYIVEIPANGGCAAVSSNTITVTLPTPDNTLSDNNSVSTCNVNQNGYVHFLDANGKLIASINSNGQNLGNVTATSYVESAPLQVADCATSSIFTSVLDRHWVITPQFQPTAPVEVILPMEQAEEVSLVTNANTNANPNDDLIGLSDIVLTKYAGPTNIDNQFLNNCTSQGGDQTLDLFNQNISGFVLDYWPAYTGNDLYASYDINSFSEFWLHGTSNISPLPVSLTAFNASCQDESLIEVSWVTESELNASHFSVERSRDGITWSTVGQITAAGNSSTLKTYSFEDNTAGASFSGYYRLRQVDFDGNETSYGPISIQCADLSGASMEVYPNPSSGNFTLRIYNDLEIENATVQIVDVNGKSILQKTESINNGVTTLLFNQNQLVKGMYYISVIADGFDVAPKKLVIN